MAGKGLTWRLSLEDAMSRAAKAAASGIDKLRNSLKSAKAAAASFVLGEARGGGASKGIANALASNIGPQAKSLIDLKEKLSGWTKGIFGKELGGKIGDGLNRGVDRMAMRFPKLTREAAKYADVMPKLASGAASVATAMASIGVMAAKAYAAFVTLSAGAALAFGKMVFGAQKVRSDAMWALEALLKSPAAAQAAYDKAAGLSVALGRDFGESVSSFTTLISRGFDTGGAERVLRAAADLSVISPGFDPSRVVTALAQMKAKGVVSMEELGQQIGEAFDIGAVIDELGIAMGKTPEQVRKAITARQVTAQQGIDAFFRAVEKKTGKSLGELAATKAGSTLTGLWAKAKNLGQQLLSTTKINWKPLEGALKNLNTFLASPAAAKGLQRISDAFSGVIEAVFGDLSGADGPQKMETILNGVAGAAEAMASSLKTAASAAGTILELFARVDAMTDNKGTMEAVKSAIGAALAGLAGVALGPIGFIGAQLAIVWRGIADSAWSGAEAVGSALKWALWGFLPEIASFLWSGLTAFTEWQGEVAAMIGGWVSDFGSWGYELGASLVQGLINAINELVPDLAAAVTAATGLSVDSASFFGDGDVQRESGRNVASAARSGFERGLYYEDQVPTGGSNAYQAGAALAGNSVVNTETNKSQQNYITVNEAKDTGSSVAGALRGVNDAF